jgi:hypothetical protein
MSHPDRDSFGAPAPSALRDAVLRRTRAVQRRRRVVRRTTLVLGLTLIYAGGYLSARLSSSRADGAEASRVARDEAPRERRAETRFAAIGDAEELELAAEIVSEPERAELLRRAGDAYLVERGDIERALRCYRRFLASPPPAKALHEESWLLTALRTQRL